MPALPLKILIIDDEPVLLRAVERVLRLFAVVHVEIDAGRALPLVETLEVDVLLCDYTMPRQNGLQVLTAAREHFPRTVRILMTGMIERPISVDAIEHGIADYNIEKPWAPGELQALVSKALRRVRARDQGPELRSTKEAPALREKVASSR